VTELSPDVLKTTIVRLGFGAWIAIQLLIKNKIASNLVVISFAIPTTSLAIESLRRDLTERAALAQKWGMQIIADKAVVHWMSQDDWNSEKWNQVKEITLETMVAELKSLSKCYIQSIDNYWKDARDDLVSLKLSDCQVLLANGKFGRRYARRNVFLPSLDCRWSGRDESYSASASFILVGTCWRRLRSTSRELDLERLTINELYVTIVKV
jgi:hypothetical protein